MLKTQDIIIFLIIIIGSIAIFSFAGKSKEEKTPKQKNFGVYTSHIPYAKTLAEYAKWHSIPTKETAELISLSHEYPVSQIFEADNMNIIILQDGYYVKLLQNLVALYKNDTHYHLDISLDGQISCVGKAPDGYDKCQEMGGKNPTPNNRIPFWIIYKLPDNLFD